MNNGCFCISPWADNNITPRQTATHTRTHVHTHTYTRARAHNNIHVYGRINKYHTNNNTLIHTQQQNTRTWLMINITQTVTN